MKHLLVLLAAWTLLTPARGQAIDPSFQPAEIFRSAMVSSIVPYADGRVLVLGDFSYANAQPAEHLVRYNFDGSVDYQFAARTPSFGSVTLPQYRSLRLMPDERILIVRPGQFQLDGRPFTDLAMLLPSGRIDSSFVPAGVAGALLNCVAVQPDGKILLGGEFTRYGGSYNYLVRLLPNGRIDTSFQPLGSDVPTALAVQSDGKIVVGSPVSGFIGGPQRGGLWRLLPNGQLDPTFPRQLLSTEQLLVQPDDKILVGGWPYNSTGPVGLVYRLLPSGAADPSFTPPVVPQHSVSSSYGYGSGQLQLQPDGNITVVARYRGSTNCRVVRLQPNGAVSNTLAVQVPEDTHIYTAAALADNRLWLGGSFNVCNGRPGSVAAFAPSGHQLPAPRLLKPGEVNSVLVQANGQILVGGSFSEVNSVPAGNVARLYANGTVDTAFTRRSATDGPVRSVAELPGGKIAVGGSFKAVGLAMLPRPLVAVLQANGQPDAGFQVSGMGLEREVRTVRPYQGNLMIGGDFDLRPNYYAYKLVVLSGTGSPVPTAPTLSDGFVSHLLEHRTAGMLVLGSFGSSPAVSVMPLPLSSAFTPLGVTVGPINHGIELPDGRLLVGGNVLLPGASLRSAVLRLQANGTVDNSFSAALYAGAQVLAVAQQPNGRILAGIGASPTGPYLQGLQPNGQADAAFNGAGSGPDGEVRCLLTQPDGAVLVGGAFQHYNGAAHFGLLRLAAVATPTRGATAGSFECYPNPAREELHLRLSAPTPPQALTLLNALGQSVRRWQPAQASSPLSLRGVPAGVYLLRVDYAEGAPLTRRVVVE